MGREGLAERRIELWQDVDGREWLGGERETKFASG
jgi:hypothetical protein